MQRIAVAGRLALALLLVAALAVLAGRVLDLAAGLTGLGWLGGLGPGWHLLIAVLVVPARHRALPVPLRRSGTAEIEAPAEAVWDLAVPAPGRRYHSAVFTRVEPVPGRADELLLRADGRIAGEGALDLRLRVTECDPPRRFEMAYPDVRNQALFGKDVVRSEVWIEPLGPGRCRLTLVEHLARFRLSTLLMFLHLNPAQDAALRIKALAEGREDPSWMTRAAREIAAGETGR